MNNKTLIKHLSTERPEWQRWARNFAIGCGVFFVVSLFMPWMQIVPGEGRVVALDAQERRQELSAPIDGRIQKWHFKEGDSIKKGDVLVEISDNDHRIMERLTRERDALDKKLQAAETGRQTAALNVARQLRLYEQGLSSRRQYELAKMEQAKLESDEAAALADMSRIDVQMSRQSQRTVAAPIDGTLVRIIKNALYGADYVHAGEPLAIIVPDSSSRIVELWVSGNDMPWVHESQRVAIQFEGWPSIFFSGMPDVTVGTFFGEVLLVDALDDGQGNFRVLVKPENEAAWPSPKDLRQGVRAYASVMLGQVPLIYEIWRRFNGFPPSNLPVYRSETTSESSTPQGGK